MGKAAQIYKNLVSGNILGVADRIKKEQKSLKKAKNNRKR